MKSFIKHSFLIFVQCLFSQNLFAHQHCMYPVAAESTEFIFLNLPKDTCFDGHDEIPDGRDWRTTCEMQGRLTEDNVKVKLYEKKPSLTCDAINGTFQSCWTPWKGKVYIKNWFSPSNKSRYAEIKAIVDKNDRLIEFNGRSDGFPGFSWLGPIPEYVLSDPYLYKNTRLSDVGLIRGYCDLPENKWLFQNKEIIFKRRYSIDGKTGFYASERREFMKLGPQIKVEQYEPDF